MARQYKFYPQGPEFNGYMIEEAALKWLSSVDNRRITGMEVVEEMTKEDAIKYLESLKNG